LPPALVFLQQTPPALPCFGGTGQEVTLGAFMIQLSQLKSLKSLLMPHSGSASPTTGIAAMVSTIRTLGDRFLHLAVLEGKQAGISLALMVGSAIGALILVITAWLALVACFVAALVTNDLVSWPVALFIAAFLCLAGAGGLGYFILMRSKDLMFTATRRQLQADSFPRAHDHDV
jgi:uncharacterized membrane protein YqjE